MIERQVIVSWFTPEEKMPADDVRVVVSISGRKGKTVYDHAIAIGSYAQDGLGWEIEGFFTGDEGVDITVNAWCDLQPYGHEQRRRKEA